MGGAIHIDSNSVVDIDDTDFLSNGAWWGGAISTVGAGKLKVSNSFFNSNSSNGWNENSDPDFPTYGGGGAIYQEYGDTLHVTNTIFTINSANAAPGGAIASYHGTEIILGGLHIANNLSLIHI